MKIEFVTLLTISPKRNLKNTRDNIIAVFNEDSILLQITKHDLEHDSFKFGIGSQIIVNDSEKYEVLEINFTDKRPRYANCLCKQVA